MIGGNSICLNMIVKNEAHVIGRCLKSVMDVIDYWVIVDTGSSDETMEIIKEHLKDKDGILYERPWINFGHNRTEALQFVNEKSDYLLIIDADEVLVFSHTFKWPELTADAYYIQTRYNDLIYSRVQLVKNSGNWRYEGVLHEYITCDGNFTHAQLSGVYNNPYPDGSRSQNPNKYLDDIQTLENVLEKEGDNARYVFYLAQSYLDAGLLSKAFESYGQRIEMGGWEEEVWWSMYQRAIIRQRQSSVWSEVLDLFLKCFEFRPIRVEPIYNIVKHYRLQGKYNTAFFLASAGIKIGFPKDEVLFVNGTIYKYWLKFEYAICCYYVGKHESAIKMYNELLKIHDLPPNLFSQIITNRKFSLDLAISPLRADIATDRKPHVLITAENEDHLFDNCLNSLLAQTNESFGVDVVFNANTNKMSIKRPMYDLAINYIPLLKASGSIFDHLGSTYFDDKIVLVIPGHCWLTTGDAVSYIMSKFSKYDIDLYYPQYSYENGQFGSALPYPSAKMYEDCDYEVHANLFAVKGEHLKKLLNSGFLADLPYRISETLKKMKERIPFDKIMYDDRILHEVANQN